MKYEDIFKTVDENQLTGEDLIGKLEGFDKQKPVYFAVPEIGEHCPELYPVNSFFSWRGSYREPSIWSDGDEVFAAGTLIEKLNDFFGSTQQGYKGGEFVMYSYSPLWCDPEGSSGCRGLKDVIECDEAIYLVVSRFEY